MMKFKSGSYRSDDNVKLNIIDKFILTLLSIYFILTPFYFWRRGLPQISDFVMVLLILITIVRCNFRFRINLSSKRVIMVGMMLTVYITIVNFIWSLVLSSEEFILSSFFYIYNYVVLITIILLYMKYKNKLLKVMFYSIIFSLILQLVILLVNGGITGNRMLGTFRNPNQLAYYALLSASLIIFLSSKINVKASVFFIALISSLLLLIASLSSTAIFAFVVLIFFYLLNSTGDKSFKNKIVFTMVFFVLILLVFDYSTGLLSESVIKSSLEHRAQSIVPKLERSIDERGYYRIFNFPQYWILGSGEGEMLSRFGSVMEFHSTLGNVQVSYGGIGLVLLISIIIMALKNDGFKSWYIITSIMIYGLTHNGIRNTMLWILLALLSSSISIFKERKTYHCIE